MSPSDQAAAEAVSFVTKLNNVIFFPFLTLLSAVAFFIFLYGCAEYILKASDASARQQGVKHITWGIIGLVIMVSAWAILSIASGTFGLADDLDCAKTGGCSQNFRNLEDDEVSGRSVR